MTANYNVTGSERKRLADYIAGFLGSEKKYLGAPGFAYQVGYIEVSKDGMITFDNRADSEEIETLLEELEKEGFHAETAAAQEAPLGLTISLPIEISEYTIAFPWFDELLGPDETDAYARLIVAMCKMSRKQKRISPRATEPDNEKYAFRCFLLRLGFIGEEYKTARKILLRRLSGNSAWKGGSPSAE